VQQTLPLAVAEFLRRWSEHVPVEHFHMVRTWGVYAATQRAALAHCRRQLLVPPVPRPEPERTAGGDFDASCPVCGRALVLSAVIPRAGALPRPPPAAYRRAACPTRSAKQSGCQRGGASGTCNQPVEPATGWRANTDSGSFVSRRGSTAKR
jgi:hypothetical protein